MNEENNTEDEIVQSRKYATGDEVADEYIRTAAGAELTHYLAGRYASYIRKYVEYLEKSDKTILTANARDAIRFYRSEAEGGASNGTIKADKAALMNLYRYLRIETDLEVSMDIIHLGNIDMTKFGVTDAYPRKPLSIDELEKLMEAIDDRRNKLMVLFTAETGGRSESVRSVKIDQVDLDKDIVHLENTKSGGYYPVPLTSELALGLERWLEVEREGYTSVPESEYLFPARHSDYLKSNNSLWEIVHKAAEEAGIQEVVRERPLTNAEQKRGAMQSSTRKWWKVDTHVLRHTFSHLLAKAGLGDDERSAALDHNSVQTTKRFYTHRDSDYIESIRDKLEKK